MPALILTVQPNTFYLHAVGDSLAGTCHAEVLLVQVRQILPHQTEASSAMYVGHLYVLHGGKSLGEKRKAPDALFCVHLKNSQPCAGSNLGCACMRIVSLLSNCVEPVKLWC